MDRKDRPATSDLVSHLSKSARRYSFFQAVDLIQKTLDDGREVGTHLMPEDERVIFEVSNDLGFPTSDIKAIRGIGRPSNGAGTQAGRAPPGRNSADGGAQLEGHANGVDRILMTVNFLGLHGSSSPLPTYYTETIAKYSTRDSLLKGFFDFFHNRLVGLLYRVIRKYRYYLLYKPNARDNFSRHIFSLFGLSDAALRDESQINWAQLLCFAGLMATRNRAPGVVASVFERAFLLDKVTIDEWIYRKVDIDAKQKWSLGRMNSILGQDSIAGDRAPDMSSKFRINLHNLDYARFADFLPNGKDHFPFRKLVEFMLRDQFSYDLKLCLFAGEARPIVLDPHDEGRLGWSSFLGSIKQDQPQDVVLTIRY